MVQVLKGDVNFEAAKEIAGSITPVTVGPMTFTTLIKNP
jgi:methylenetetrahydrofolate dehydrogenase (NADP+)/methenyltetrahydrofolate cyclohydrolase